MKKTCLLLCLLCIFKFQTLTCQNFWIFYFTLRLTLYECVVNVCIQRQFLIWSWTIIFNLLRVKLKLDQMMKDFIFTFASLYSTFQDQHGTREMSRITKPLPSPKAATTKNNIVPNIIKNELSLKVWKNGQQKTLQLVLQHCCKTSWIAMSRILPPTSNLLTTWFVARQVWCGW